MDQSRMLGTISAAAQRPSWARNRVAERYSQRNQTFEGLAERVGNGGTGHAKGMTLACGTPESLSWLGDGRGVRQSARMGAVFHGETFGFGPISFDGTTRVMATQRNLLDRRQRV